MSERLSGSQERLAKDQARKDAFEEFLAKDYEYLELKIEAAGINTRLAVLEADKQRAWAKYIDHLDLRPPARFN